MSNLSTILSNAEHAASRLTLPARLIAAWWISENGWQWPVSNNPGNISWPSSELPPQEGIFRGAVRVEPNHVIIYDTPEAGVEAFCELLAAPTVQHGGNKILDIDAEGIRQALATGGVDAACKLIGESNWSTGHYDDGRGPGSLILDVYHSPELVQAFASATKPEPAQASVANEGVAAVHYVQPGETLSAIGLRYQVPWPVLARFNELSDPNLIEVGQKILIPARYRVRPGDTLDAIALRYHTSADFLARVNNVNPDWIYAWQTLFV